MTPPAPELNSPLASGGDSCPNCGAPLAPDQRYCLACGQRRGDPRLPFMDAVTFMESAKQPPQADAAAAGVAAQPPDRRPFISANASLVAGVATLVLAIGVGVLIGRSGDSGAGNAGNQAPQIIRVGGAGGEGEAGKAGGERSDASIGGAGGANQPKSATQKKAKKKLQKGSSGTTKAVEEVYEPAAGVKLAEPEQQVGGKCDPSAEGCNSKGEFDGSFFE